MNPKLNEEYIVKEALNPPGKVGISTFNNEMVNDEMYSN
jgi:hypothetical protein